MSEQKPAPQSRSFLAGKVISNFGQSSIDCVVRRITDRGAGIEVESPPRRRARNPALRAG
jgi:hypothetical protein